MWTLTPNALNEECNAIGNWNQYLVPVTVDPAGEFYFVSGGVLTSYTSSPPITFDEATLPSGAFSISTSLYFDHLYASTDGKGGFDLRVYTGNGYKIRIVFYNDCIMFGSDSGYSYFYMTVAQKVQTIYQFDIVIDSFTNKVKVDVYVGTTYVGTSDITHSTTTLRGYLFGLYDSTSFARMQYLKVGNYEGESADVDTLPATNITQSNFVANGRIDSIGEGITIVKRGFCYKKK